MISPIPVVSCTFDDVTDNSIEGIEKNSMMEISNSSNNKKNSSSSSSSTAAAEFAAAGVLLYRFQSGDLKVLLGEEYRTEGLVLNVLGGKRNDKESKSQDTASREFREESGYLISKAEISYLIAQSTTRLVYLGFAKYYLYCVQCPESLSDLDRRYNDLTKRPIECEMDRLHWIRWSYLVSAVKKATYNGSKAHFIARSWREIKVFKLSNFLIKTVRSKEVVTSISLQNADNYISEIYALVSKEAEELKKNKKELKLNEHWKSLLKVPKVLPRVSPITALKSTDTAYAKVVEQLDEATRSRIVTIRKVDVQVRTAEHYQYETELLNMKREITLTDPVYHGTSERWRATNIAFKSFDLSYVANGRSQGDGVYAAADARIPLGYTKSNGTLIRMRGIVTPDDYNADFIVFRNPKQVLPTYLIDFSADEGDNPTGNSHAVALQQEEEQVKKNVEERKKEIKTIKAEEENYIAMHKQQYRSAKAYYIEKIEAIAKEMSSYEGKSTSMSEEDETRFRFLWRSFEREKSQFMSEPLLPLYADKRQVLQKLLDNDVLIVCAATGSGKSSQLPQYLMDNVFDEKETRKVAVLLPRRFNALALCKYVSKQRYQSVGMEVGYSVGQGDICVSLYTRIEFMTHGLFINRATNPYNLLKTYCAVIVDEAHERSVDVDVSLSLLRKALAVVSDVRSNTASPTVNKDYNLKQFCALFKVIVASASVGEDQLCLFRDFLTPSVMIRSSLYHVGGSMFPVLIIHRPDAEPNWDEASSNESSKALASYAIDIAIELMGASSSDGNVLIFMPGESIINRCMDNIISWSKYANKSSDASSNKDSNKESNKSSNNGSIKDSNNLKATTDVSNSPPSLFESRKKKSPHEFEFCLKVEDKSLIVGIYAFHGQVDESTKQRMIYHEGQDRVIILSTNSAETGLTLPNIRYVIDMGLERTVTWNNQTCMQEMRTMKITQSSMKQRTGRAGRVASGICVRLYSKDTAESFDFSHEPEIESGIILKTVLLQSSINSSTEKCLELPTAIPEDSLENANNILKLYDAIDQDGNITDIGNVLLKFGINLRLGRFLVACNANHCLGSGITIAAMVTCSNALNLLPSKGTADFYTIALIDPQGDHFTFLNIYNEYSKLEAADRITFCSEHDLSYAILQVAERTRDHLEETCLSLSFDVMDDIVFTNNKDGLMQKLRESLCVAYFDQLLTTCQPGLFKLVTTNDNTQKQLYKACKSLTARSGIRTKISVGIPVTSTQQITTDNDDDDSMEADNNSDTKSQSTDDNSTLLPLHFNTQPDASDIYARLGSQSSLWVNIDRSAMNSFAIYGSIMLTDTSTHPNIQYVSYVSADDMANGSAIWGINSTLTQILKDLQPTNASIHISGQMANYLLLNQGRALKHYIKEPFKVQAKVRKATDSCSLDVIGASRTTIARVERALRRLHIMETEKVIIQVKNIKSEDIGRIVKFLTDKKGENKKEVVGRINQMVQNGLGVDDEYVAVQPKDIQVEGKDKCEISIQLSGLAKQFASSVIGVVQNIISAHLTKVSTLPNTIIYSPSTEKNSELFVTSSLNVLATSVMNPSSVNIKDRTSTMIFMAHAAIWYGKAFIYGGFVRDTVVNHDSPNDIDVGFDPNKVNLHTLKSALINAAKQINLILTKEYSKGNAGTYAIQFRSATESWKCFDIDLVDQEKVSDVFQKPGVDCDVGNFMLEAESEAEFGLKLKTKNINLVSLSVSQKNCQNHVFVFYYDTSQDINSTLGNTAKYRLQKYFQRGWTCVSHIHEPTLSWAISSGYGSLLKPLKQFSGPYNV